MDVSTIKCVPCKIQVKIPDVNRSICDPQSIIVSISFKKIETFYCIGNFDTFIYYFQTKKQTKLVCLQTRNSFYKRRVLKKIQF